MILLSGIGPKTALALVGHLPPEQFKVAIWEKDAAACAKVPGIGKRTAERLIVELSSKITTAPSSNSSSHTSKAELALIQLGLSQSKAEVAVAKAMQQLGQSVELSTLIAAVLHT